MSIENKNMPTWDEPATDDDVASVFGITLDGDSDEGGDPTPNEPSAGTEGEAGGEQSPPASNPEPPKPDGDSQPAQQPAQPAADPQAAPSPQPASDPRDLELASLRAQLEAANGMLAQAQEAPKADQPAAAGQPGEEKPKAPTVIPVQLPPAMLESIFAEDPQQAATGLNNLLTAFATGMNARFEAALEARTAELTARFEGKWTEQEQQKRQAVEQQEAATNREDYFKAFPQHNQPLLMPILAQELDQLLKEFPGAGWSEQFRNALGSRVEEKLRAAGFGGQQAPTRPAPMMPTAARPAPTDSIQDEIADVFSL